MDAIVAARVPVEIKERGTAVLASIGATPTQLINAAYLYVLETRRLPVAEPSHKPKHPRELSQDRLEAVEAQMQRMLIGKTSYSDMTPTELKRAFAARHKAEYAALT
jgi:antitoxin component of RelBE/YafQ-DinJ toxin-antitoxin module